MPEQTLVISFFRLTNVFFFFPIVPTTGTPNRIANFFKSIFIPFFFASSNKFTQTIMLELISIIWNTKFIFRSKEVASTTITIASSFSKQIKFLAISSSSELDIKE